MSYSRTPAHMIDKVGVKGMSKADQKKREEHAITMTNSQDVQPSEFLPEHLHERFHWFIDQFEEFGLFGSVDGDALSRYLIADLEYWKITGQLAEMTIDDHGYASLTLAQNRYFQQTLALSKELGLTLLARTRLRRDKEREPEKKVSEEEELFGDSLKLVK